MPPLVPAVHGATTDAIAAAEHVMQDIEQHIDTAEYHPDQDTRKRRRPFTTWEEKIGLLKSYKKEHGDCRIPQRSKEHPELAQFTKKMREYYRLKKNGTYKGKLLTDEKILELESIGFEWEVRTTPNKSFEERMDDLRAFKAEKGHCNVPRVYKEDVSLGRWCHVMRCSYWQIKEGKKPMYKLQEDEIRALEEAGFKWRIKRGAKPKNAGPGDDSVEPGTYKSKAGKKITSFAERIEQLKAYKAVHGHIRVTMGQNKNLAIFVNHMRGARRDPNKTNGVKLTPERIKALDSIGFDWAPPRTKIRWSANDGREENIAFEDRLAALSKFKEEHGHVLVTRKEDRSLAAWCHHARNDRANENSTFTEDQIKALDDIGFRWNVEDQKDQWITFEERIQQLKEFKERHGHYRVTSRHDRPLALFCSDVRSAHRPGSKKSLPEERVKALDAIGFEWNPPKTNQPTSFEDRIVQLKEFKEKHGHLKVTDKLDKKLASYCNNVRQARRKPDAGIMNITEEKIAALDEIGFVWNVTDRTGAKKVEPKSFEERVEELKAYKEKYGDTNVTPKRDKSLSNFVKSVRSARKNPNSSRLVNEARIAMLDAIGFRWETTQPISFDVRLEQLREFKEKHGHLRVTSKLDKQLAPWCSNMRAARRNPEASGILMSQERIDALDAIGFEWEVPNQSDKTDEMFQGYLKELIEFKRVNGNLDVPPESAELYEYCEKLKKAKLDPNLARGFLSFDMLTSLNSIGFPWAEPQAPMEVQTTEPLPTVEEQKEEVDIGKTFEV
jgi:hypothetical protein